MLVVAGRAWADGVFAQEGIQGFPVQVREVVQERHSDRQLTLLVLSDGPILDPSWTVDHVGLEELLLAYMAPERLPQPKQPERLPLRWHG